MTLLPRATDVFVIGGGPAGLAAAIAARRLGFDVTLADSVRPPIDKACGEGIMPDGVAAAGSLGVLLDEACARPFSGIRFCADGIAARASFPYGRGLGLRRTALHQIMVDRAAALGVRLCWGVCVTGVGPDAVAANGSEVRARWIVGADGTQSRVRRWASLDAGRRRGFRFGFRTHFQIAPWSDFVEIHWGHACQLYITPVAPNETCVVLISRDPHLRLQDALPAFPDVARRLRGAALCGPPAAERAGITASYCLKSVFRDRIALIGDASGSVDAITGEGICLLFQQAVALAGALHSGDLRLYQSEHRRLARRPELMARLMLLLERRARLRRAVIRSLASHPRLFARMLSMHVGNSSPLDFLGNGLSLAWHVIARAGARW